MKKGALKRSKPFEDSISETISFVIKGKFTPLKTTSIGKSRILSKKINEKKVKNKEKCVKSAQNDKNLCLTEKKKKKVAQEASKKIPTNKKATSKTEITNKRSKSVNKIVKAEPNKQKKVKDIATKKVTKILKKIGKGTVENKKTNKPKKVVLLAETKDKKANKAAKVVKQPPVKKLQKIAKPKRKKHLEDVDEASTSDEVTLDLLFTNVDSAKESNTGKTNKSDEKPVAIEKKPRKTSVTSAMQKTNTKSMLNAKSKAVFVKKKLLKIKKEDTKTRKLKLLGHFNSPKRHRVASLNALAKVHCLYENETRGNILDAEGVKPENVDKKSVSAKEIESHTASTRILRSVPGLRAIGRHWDLDDNTSSSSEDNDEVSTNESKEKSLENKPEEVPVKKEKKRRRNRTEIMMDLKDMVVRKRMASLNASAILGKCFFHTEFQIL